MIGYRIVEIKNGKVLSLFHGTQGSREIFLDVWNLCDFKFVRDGSKGQTYISGWHVMKSKEECENLFEKTFRIKENRKVIKCEVRGNIHPKHSWVEKDGACLLANEIFISSADIK
jgi:hypothetical protein